MSEAGRLLILADDFTGACDGAGALAAVRRTLVVHGVPALWPGDAERAEVLSVDLDVRERSDGEAETCAAETARHLSATRIFLKIDSTLRGPIAGLVTGALTGSGSNMAVIAPAFPEQARLLRHGRVLVDGQPGASLTDALGMRGTALLGADSARSVKEVEQAVEHARMRGARHVVVDADGVDCLRSVADAWQRHSSDWLLVGSAGLARQVAGGANIPTNGIPTSRQGARGVRGEPGAPGVILVIAGSPAPQTQAQIERLRGLASIVVVDRDAPVAARPSEKHAVLVLCTPPASERDSGEFAQAVAETTDAWAAKFTPSAVVLAGGATARLVCERLSAHGVRLAGEFLPGIPYGSLQGGVWDGVRVVTKAGGFGAPDTLLDVVHALGVSSVAERSHD